MSATRAVEFPVYLLGRLTYHSAKRRMTAEALARLLVETLVEEDLVDAVMDDVAASHQFAPPRVAGAQR